MAVRCFFMRNGHFAAVEILPDGPPADTIRQAEALFKRRAEAENFNGFEIWEADRLIHRSGSSGPAPRRQNSNFVVFGLVVGALQSAF